MKNDKKKQPHFLETDSGFKRLLRASKKEIPSEETLIAIRDYQIRSGKLDAPELMSGVPGTPAFYLHFLLTAEAKSLQHAAAELKVTNENLETLRADNSLLAEKSLFQFCEKFVSDHPEFALRPLFTLLKRAIVVYSMTSDETALRKAARKKPRK
ncbi:MAG TPA: hypothetical protein VLH08_07320 [Acidobacteriota bacterium]|nr:hypothetical protein [Acidobacteriota bacterium]